MGNLKHICGTESLPLDVLFLYLKSLPDREEAPMKKLSNAKAGRYTVKWIFTEPALKKMLAEIRIEVGKEITVISNCFGQILLRSEAGAFVIDTEAAAGVTI